LSSENIASAENAAIHDPVRTFYREIDCELNASNPAIAARIRAMALMGFSSMACAPSLN
jgi:hypothetical protein